MSDMLRLAEAVADLAVAQNKLADAIIATGAVMGAAPEAPPSSPRSEVSTDPQAETPKATRKKAEPKAPEPEPETTSDDAGADAVQDLSVEIKKLVLEIAKGNREGVVALLKEFGAEKAGDVPLDRHPEFLGRLEDLKAEGDLA